MPFYTVECKKCQEVYEIWSPTIDGREKNIKKAKCLKCNSKSKKQIITDVPNYAFSNPVGTDRYSNSHDYRAKHEIHKKGGALDLRRRAEAASKVGPRPYKHIDDINSGKYFGDVK